MGQIAQAAFERLKEERDGNKGVPSEDQGLRFQSIYPGTPEQKLHASRQPGFLRLEFQHPSGKWRNVVPLRQEAAPAIRAVYSQMSPEA